MAEKNIESMDDLAAELEDSLKRLHEGDVMDATVVSVDEEGVSVDLDYYAPGRIEKSEMSDDPTYNVMNDACPGDTFKAVILNLDDGGGNIILSKKAADREYSWDKLEEMKNERHLITGKISGVSGAGAYMYVEGIRGFIPISKLDIKYVEDTEEYLGKTVSVIITDVNKEKRNLILSAKELLNEAALAEESEKIKKLKVGAVARGTVESLKDYGAFIRLDDGPSGLLHVSQISERRIKHPGAVLNVGDKVKVMITKIENGKISLSMKALNDFENSAGDDEEEVREYKGEYRPNNPFAELLKDIKLK